MDIGIWDSYATYLPKMQYGSGLLNELVDWVQQIHALEKLIACIIFSIIIFNINRPLLHIMTGSKDY